MEKSLLQDLSKIGLYILGHNFLTKEKVRLLIGNKEDSLEYLFTDEFQGEHPLDKWTKENLDLIARSYEGEIEYPFTGPPFKPFVTWALQSKSFFESPIKILIHRDFGLWTALRGALTIHLDKLDDITQKHISDLSSDLKISPCLNCSEKFCLNHCPVNAFDNGKYKVQDCKNEILKKEDCFSNGCLARRSCPIGRPYGEKQKAFHMKAFVKYF